RISVLGNSFLVVSIIFRDSASATRLSLPGRCLKRRTNSCMSSYHLQSPLLVSLMLVQLDSVLLSVRTVVHRPAKISGYFRSAETMAKSSRSFVGHFYFSGESVLESQTKGIPCTSCVTNAPHAPSDAYVIRYTGLLGSNAERSTRSWMAFLAVAKVCLS